MFINLAIIRRVSLIILLYSSNASASQIAGLNTHKGAGSLSCFKRSQGRVGEGRTFSYPLRIGAASDGKMLVVNANKKIWLSLRKSEQLAQIEDLACWYFSDHTNKRQCEGFAVLDKEGNKIATFDKSLICHRY